MSTTAEVRSLTVIPPWSLAIVEGHKTVENRVRNLAGSWRGRLLILSSKGKWDAPAAQFIAGQLGTSAPSQAECAPGHYIGAVTLVDAHRASGGCCSPWGEPDVWHLVLGTATRFLEPIRATGHLGLRKVTDTALIGIANQCWRWQNPDDDEEMIK